MIELLKSFLGCPIYHPLIREALLTCCVIIVMATSTQYAKPWTKEDICKDRGVLVEGKVRSSRIHTVNVTKKEEKGNALPNRFLAVVVNVDLACIRNFDANGMVIYFSPHSFL